MTLGGVYPEVEHFARWEKHLMSKLCGLGLLLLVLVTSQARAAEQDEIDKAVKAGVDYLKKQNGHGGHGDGVGGAALVGLTLLECGLTPGDDAVARALQVVRDASPTLTHTYSIALSILLLDRNGDASDVTLIESLGIRLMAGQNGEGGWSYDCPGIDQAEQRRLATHVKSQNELRTSKELPRTDPKDKPAKKTEKDLPREIQNQLAQLRNARGGRGAGGDNSNTQFATLGLWVARRHGLPVDGHLRLVEQRFRQSQAKDGGWNYMYAARGGGGESTATMTCAGLLALAVSYGVANDQGGAKKVLRDPAKDDGLKAGLMLLSTAIGQPLVREKGKGPRGNVQRADGRAYYFLWSMERVAVALDLKTIGKKDWYAWGSDVLVTNQQADGSWRGDYGGGGVDTCFALLFLRRANLARDLTANFNKFGDPGEITLKTGGVGGGALTGEKPESLKSPLEATKEEPKSKPETPKTTTPLSSKEPENKAVKLGQELVRAEGKQKRETYLKELREAKGQDYTDALSDAIRQLDGEGRAEAREALALRLTRMTAKTLQAYMQDNDAEIRRAAAMASGYKDCRENIPAIIDLLKDKESSVWRAAYAVLKEMTSKDFGPPKDAKPEDQAKAVAAWKAWWKENGK